MKRRAFVKTAVATTLAPLASACGPEPTPPPHDGFDAGALVHLIPTANHERFRIKASFRRAFDRSPTLHVGGLAAEGRSTDPSRQYFTFDVAGLEPATRYTLVLRDASGQPLCDEWPLSTFPPPAARPDRLRLLLFTCAGGPDDLYNYGFFNAYLPVAQRQRLFARALSFQPDAAVANGDHVYWDMKSRFGWAMGESWKAWLAAGWFDRDRPLAESHNRSVLKRAFGPQIADLYGVYFRSTPMFFLQDDHDYGENDEASDELRTFPADPFMLDLARTTQALYYPELLGGEGLPREAMREDGVSESFGSLRYGDLFEALLYDCRREMTNSLEPGASVAEAGFVSPPIEAWLKERTARSPALHLAHMPSTPVLWTAGKWAEWYPDFRDPDGVLGTRVEKPWWPAGWGKQHDRLLDAFALRSDRTPLFLSGDLHATAIGRIVANRGRSLDRNPITSVLTGAIGTGALGWPSRFRGTVPIPSQVIESEVEIEPIEENGFTLADFTRDAVRFSFFRWKPEHGEEAIERLEPFREIELPRPA